MKSIFIQGLVRIREEICSFYARYNLGKTPYGAAGCRKKRDGSTGLAEEWARKGWSGLAVQEEQANILAARMEAYRKQSGQLGKREREK
jgi:hypothetical protein